MELKQLSDNPANSLSKLRLSPDTATLNYLCDKEAGFRTGLPELDKKLRGLQGLVCVMGEPKVNKSTLVLQWALHNAKKGVAVYYLDLENGLPLLTQRTLCHLHQLSQYQLKRRSEQELVSMVNQVRQQLPFYVCSEGIGFDQFGEHVTELMSQHDKAIVILDSIQWLQSKQVDTRLKVAEWVSQLDAMKLKYRNIADKELVIVGISEKNRGGYKMASAASPKESGSIEYKAEQLIDLQYDEETGHVRLTCVENRHGPKRWGIELEKVLAEPTNEYSFTFTMREVQQYYNDL